MALAGLVLPAAAFLAWLIPVVRDTASHAPGKDDLHRAFTQYAGQLDVSSDTSYRLVPEVFGRAGAIAIVALLFVPLAGLALRRRWAAYVLGGFLAVAAVMLISPLFVLFSDLVSISQSRRAAGFWPLSFAFAGGFVVLAALLRGLILPLALAAGIVLQLAYPGEFDYKLHEGGPALVDLDRDRRRSRRARDRPVAAAGDRAARRRRGPRCRPLRAARGRARCGQLEPVGRAAAQAR